MDLISCNDHCAILFVLSVIPLSTRTGWEEAFQNWCPNLRVEFLHGYKKERVAMKERIWKERSTIDVIVTTYGNYTGLLTSNCLVMTLRSVKSKNKV